MLVASAYRLGTETAFSVSAKVDAMRRDGHDVINLGIGQPDFSTADHIVEAAIKALKDKQHGYTASNGILPLRETVADYLYKRYQKSISPEQVLIVPGGKVTMFLAIMLLGEAGKEIIYPNPGFPIYESVINYSGAKNVPLELREDEGFALNADKLLSLITDKTSLIIVNTPSNPTGGVTPKEELDKLAKGLEKFPHVTLLVDEIYSHQTYDGLVHHSFLSYEHLRERVIILEGWSKTWAMTGWRLGYGIWPKHLIEVANKLCINIHSCVNAPAQFAAIAAMQGTQEPVKIMLEEFDNRRKFIFEEINKSDYLSCILPKGAFYAFVNIKKLGKNSLYWQDKLLDEAKVAMIAGTSFGAYGEGYLRLSYAASLTQLQEALQRLDAFLSDL